MRLTGGQRMGAGRVLAALALCLALAGGTRAAQRSVEDMRDVGKILNEQDRVKLHPGDPLHVVGIEEGDNGFRERTPALLRSDRVVTLVDPEASRARKLALYEGHVFSRPLATVDVARSSGAEAPPRPRPDTLAKRATTTDPAISSTWLIVSCFAAIGLILWLFFHLRPARR